jgi:hypothetical protein
MNQQLLRSYCPLGQHREQLSHPQRVQMQVLWAWSFLLSSDNQSSKQFFGLHTVILHRNANRSAQMRSYRKPMVA